MTQDKNLSPEDLQMTEPTQPDDVVARYYSKDRVDPLDAAFSKRAKPGMTVLDAGCGDARGCTRISPWQDMYIVGIDYGPSVKNNPFCNDALVGDLSTLPFANNTFDLIHCRWVLEHIAHPQITFREFARILKPGGFLLALTPNLYHYATMIAWLTPHWFHQWWWKEDYDPFPTCYRANSRRSLQNLCRQSGLQIEQLQLLEGPPLYLKRNRPAFFCGVLYERLVNATAMFSWLRHDIVLEAQVI